MNKSPKLRFPEFNEEWEDKKLNELLFEHKIRNYELKYDKQDVLSVSKEYGIVNQIALLGRSYAGVSVDNYHVVRKGDIVYTKSPLKLNPYGIIKVNKGRDGIVSTLYAVYSCKEEVCGLFLDYYFQLDDHTNKYVRPLVNKGAKNDMKINNSYFLSDKIFVPLIKEQTKISSFLSIFDKKIEKQNEKVESLKEYKKGIMHKIFSQEIRFKKDSGEDYPEWKLCKIGDCFSERSEKGFSDFELLAVSIQNGISKKSDIDGRDNSSEDKSNYKLVKPNDIVYNSMRMWQGASGVSKFLGIVSPAYTVLVPKKSAYSDYFAYQFKAEDMIYQFRKYSQGLTSDTWNLKYSQIKDIKIKLPSLEEQEKLADLLSKIDQKIEKEQEKLDLLNQWKKGLLQQMFV